MSRIQEKFSELYARGQKALICYLMAGDPTLDATERAVKAVREAGADIIELGFPFSDPLADGPTIQAAAYRALQNPFGLKQYFGLIKRIRQEDQVPLVLMTYYNVIFHFGLEEFAQQADDAGLDGLIIPDLPLEEGRDLLQALDGTALDLIQLAAPTTSLERIGRLTQEGTGFLYYVSRTGITGARDSLPEELLDRLEEVVAASRLPVAVGFGISNAGQVRAIAKTAEGVVIGSAIVQRFGTAPNLDEGCNRIVEFLGPIARALHEQQPREESR